MEGTFSLVDFAVGFAFTVVLCGVFAAVLVYLVQVQKTFNACSPGNRKMQGGLVWLMLVPLFGLYWQFRVNAALAESLRQESRSRNIPTLPPYPKRVGIAKAMIDILAVLMLAGMFAAGSAPADPVTQDFYNPVWDGVLGAFMISFGILLIASLVLWIILWARLRRARMSLGKPLVFQPVYAWPHSPMVSPSIEARVAPPRYCSNCGATLGPGRFCMRCGKECLA